MSVPVEQIFGSCNSICHGKKNEKENRIYGTFFLRAVVFVGAMYLESGLTSTKVLFTNVAFEEQVRFALFLRFFDCCVCVFNLLTALLLIRFIFRNSEMSGQTCLSILYR